MIQDMSKGHNSSIDTVVKLLSKLICEIFQLAKISFKEKLSK